MKRTLGSETVVSIDDDDAAEEPDRAKRSRVSTQTVRVAHLFVSQSAVGALETPFHKNVLLHDSRWGSAPYKELCASRLRDLLGRSIANMWSFARVYPCAKARCVKLTRVAPPRVLWNYEAAQFVDEGLNPKPDYWKWRRAGFRASYAVDDPAGYGDAPCLYWLWPLSKVPIEVDISHCAQIEGPSDDDDAHGSATEQYVKLDLLLARRVIYCELYRELCGRHPVLSTLRELYLSGRRIQLADPDGPRRHYGGRIYRRIKPGTSSMEVSLADIQTLLDDPKRPFGHAYAIAALLMDPSGAWIFSRSK